MASETLLTAARRVVRFFNIDMNKGGLITEDTQQAVGTLDRMVNLYKDGIQVRCGHCRKTTHIHLEDKNEGPDQSVRPHAPEKPQGTLDL